MRKHGMGMGPCMLSMRPVCAARAYYTQVHKGCSNSQRLEILVLIGVQLIPGLHALRHAAARSSAICWTRQLKWAQRR